MQIVLFFFTKVYRYLFLKVLMLRILFVVLKLHIVLSTVFIIFLLFDKKFISDENCSQLDIIYRKKC